MEGRIAYRGIDDRGYTAQPDGTDVRPVSPHSASYRLNGRRSVARESWPTWAPDGSRVAFSHVSAEIDGSLRLELRTADSQTGEGASVFVNPPGSPTIGGRIPHYAQWSSDGRYLAFVAATSEGMGLYLAQPGEGAARQVLRGSPLYLAWAPERPVLLVHAQERHLLVDAARPQVLTELEVRSVVHRVSSWAPDGNAMAYVWDSPGQRLMLSLADRDGRRTREVAPVRAMAALLWSPAGDALAVGDDQDPTMPFYPGLRVVRLDGTQRELTRERVLAFFWAPDGRRLAYVTFGSTDGTVAAVVLDLGAASVRETTRVELAPSYGLMALLPFFDQFAASHRIWSPDSRSLLVCGMLSGEAQARGEGVPHIYVVDAEGKERPRPIAQGHMAFWSPR